VESYRRIRNTLRFLLANTADFDLARDALPVEEWVEIDRYALAMTRAMASACLADYQKFDFHLVAQRVQNFCSEDLGGFWLDILKDRLYTTGAKSRPRRSAQSALYYVTQMLLRLMAPILSFTAEEAWAVLNPPLAGEAPDSIFLHTWKEVLPQQPGEKELIEKWSRIRAMKAVITKSLEEARSTGAIGSSLQAEIIVGTSTDDVEMLRSLGDEVRFAFLTSRAEVREAAGSEFEVTVAPSRFPKCERCWHYREDVGSRPRHATICARCVSNLDGPGEERLHA
jgi:isoleucyl-tRNA synthetase